MKNLIENLTSKPRSHVLNGTGKLDEKELKKLTIRALKKGNENGIQIETPYSDEKQAVEYAKKKIQSWKKKRIYGWKFEIINFKN